MKEIEMNQEEIDIVRGLQHEVLELIYHWTILLQLYGTSDEYIKIMKGVADEIFGTFQTLLWDHVLLTIGKLCDPAQTGIKQENISIENAINLLSKHASEMENLDLKKNFETLKDKCKVIKKIRHKRLAHFDKKYMTERFGQIPLPGVSKTTIEEALALIVKIMNRIESGFGEVTMIYNLPERPIGEDLIWYLKQSGTYREVQDRAA